MCLKLNVLFYFKVFCIYFINTCNQLIIKELLKKKKNLDNNNI